MGDEFVTVGLRGIVGTGFLTSGNQAVKADADPIGHGLRRSPPVDSRV